jgi:hypothetical protein
VAGIGKGEAAGVPEHVRVRLEIEAGLRASPFDHLCQRTIALPPPKPRGGLTALAGGEERAGSGSTSVTTMHALFKAKAE